MHSTKTKTLTAAVLAAPLLLGCAQGSDPSQAADAASSPAASTATSASSAPSAVPSTQTATQQSPAAPTAGSAAPTTGAGAGAPATPAPGTTDMPANTTLPAVEDPCAGSCTVSATVPMNHPTYGPMTVKVYERLVNADSAPQGFAPSYAVYQGDTPVNYETSLTDDEQVSFGTKPKIGDQQWDVPGETPVDTHGNLYLTNGSGVTVLTPTAEGYDSHGTMPPGKYGSEYPFHRADLVIAANGEATIVEHVLKDYQEDTGKTRNWIWDGAGFHP